MSSSALRPAPPTDAPLGAPDGVKCGRCGESCAADTFRAALWVCPFCRYHHRITPAQRLEFLADPGSFEELFGNILPSDPLRFTDRQPYLERVAESQSRTGQSEAVLCGTVRIDGEPAVVVIFNFFFMGGSMGSAVGERIVRCFEEAARRGTGIITFSASGGARMQEGMNSLMQMAKTVGAVTAFRKSKHPYISILTDPTTGGVSASFSILGDVVLAEPKALIGFNGPRVVKDAFGHDVSEGAQKSEYLYENGFIDGIVERKDQAKTIGRLLRMFRHEAPGR